MNRFATKLAVAAAAGMIAFAGAASAQQQKFDGNKFFEELSNRGVATKGIDGNKFFEELSNRGVSMPDMVKAK